MDITFKKNESFNYHSRYFDFYEISNIKIRLVFIELSINDWFSTRITSNYECFKYALIELKEKTELEPSSYTSLNKLVDDANKILNSKTSFFALEFH